MQRRRIEMKTRPNEDIARTALENLPRVAETIRDAYVAHVEFAETVRTVVNLATKAGDPAMDRVALEKIAAALDAIGA